MIKIRAPIWSDISGHSGASGGRFRLDFGTIWGAISGSRARDAKLAKIAPRHSESMIFGVPRGPKKDQKWSADLARSFGHLEASGGRLGLDVVVILGSILGSRARHAIFVKIAPRHSESTIFRGSGGPKMSPKWDPK